MACRGRLIYIHRFLVPCCIALQAQTSAIAHRLQAVGHKTLNIDPNDAGTTLL